MTDREVIDKMLSNSELADYGKYEKYQLAQAAQISYPLIGAIARHGLADVDMQPMSGVTGNYHTHYELNDRWRLARRLGGYDALLKYEADKAAKKAEQEQLKYDLLKSQRDFQQLNNTFIEKQTRLIESQVETNRVNRITNILIAIFTGAASVWYLREIIRSTAEAHITNMKLRVKIIDDATLGLLLLGIVSILRIFQLQRKRRAKI